MKRISYLQYLLLLLFVVLQFDSNAQSKPAAAKSSIYVDDKGVIRWKDNNKEASFFGVNYTVPFAFGYRSHKTLQVPLEKAIDQDVYHLARLGLNAFRVHVWDTEITDSTGNLIENEHLRLFDYLIAQLKKRNIKILITPIAFWGNGYPERDEATGSFSAKYGKDRALVEEEAFKAQERYLEQFFKHKNPYTSLTYTDDPDVLAMEINNEPHHSGPPERTTEYINRMTKAVKGTGWNKPVFYNISESPKYADAVVKADVDGHSFQWYPTGLVANFALKGNHLPHVDTYAIPFDSIPAFRNRAKMVYEFDSGDVLDSYMYPAMARSFRTAGFQWATQFAYDPLATAYANPEYQTHYLNLAYTPSKAISFLIAAKVFDRVPRLKSYGQYPASATFESFRVSYEESLSEMNTNNAFYYSNSTKTKPLSPAKLKHVAGVGSSEIVNYKGTGAYFLDKVKEGVWRLEVMPDVIQVRDPFERPSLKKEVTRIQWGNHQMTIDLPDLGADYTVEALHEGDSLKSSAEGRQINISPGVYLLAQKGKKSSGIPQRIGNIGLREFVAPEAFASQPAVAHHPDIEVSAGKSHILRFQIAGVEPSDKISVQLNHTAGGWKTLGVSPVAAHQYQVELPSELQKPGELSYKLIVRKGNEQFFTFPGGHTGDPYNWESVQADSWKTRVAAVNAAAELFNPATDRSRVSVYAPLWKNNKVEYISSFLPGEMLIRQLIVNSADANGMGFQFNFGDKLSGRTSELNTFDRIIFKARAIDKPLKAKLVIVTKDAEAYSKDFNLSRELHEFEIPIGDLKPDAQMLLPRPYPGFHPLYFKAADGSGLKLSDAEKVQIIFEAAKDEKNQGLELGSILLLKRAGPDR
ncbi:cellulase family glycosylhydrolase [Arcticibacter sp.]|uniref:cellulase family glycosylhydrolase n=1 Tax=Arcticibacter sp. TaxID=1872630 RepID=UPI00388E060A